MKSARKVDPMVWRGRWGPRSAPPTAICARPRRCKRMKAWWACCSATGRRQPGDRHQYAKSNNAVATLQALASPTTNLEYNVVTPCRILDTRKAGGRMTNQETRNFIASNPGGNFAAQGGTAHSDCGIPASPAAVVVNVTSALPNAKGYVTGGLRGNPPGRGDRRARGRPERLQ